MDTLAKIKSFIKEANLYQSQGLLNEARQRYENAEALIHECDTLPNKPVLLEGLAKKLETLAQAENKIHKKAAPSEISAKDKDLIKKCFPHQPEMMRTRPSWKARWPLRSLASSTGPSSSLRSC